MKQIWPYNRHSSNTDLTEKMKINTFFQSLCIRPKRTGLSLNPVFDMDWHLSIFPLAIYSLDQTTALVNNEDISQPPDTLNLSAFDLAHIPSHSCVSSRSVCPWTNCSFKFILEQVRHAAAPPPHLHLPSPVSAPQKSDAGTQQANRATSCIKPSSKFHLNQTGAFLSVPSLFENSIFHPCDHKSSPSSKLSNKSGRLCKRHHQRQVLVCLPALKTRYTFHVSCDSHLSPSPWSCSDLDERIEKKRTKPKEFTLMVLCGKNKSIGFIVFISVHSPPTSARH